ncbi:organic cation/carnitine transporter 7-like [Mercurialis annua]|uniref:organic cation/carnitine transporter 7-like n=1 Tax=Mercurialis annua TaxID=3986 RepID=UPI00215E9130|nr:organic cation/carnitine transporter 7-like [Mercurialis annua]
MKNRVKMGDLSNQKYTLDEALDAVGFGKFQGLVLVYAGLGSFSEAMEMMILSFVGPAVNAQWALSSSQESLLTSAVFAGMLLGAYSWGLISDNYGRRKAILGSTILTCGAGLLSTFSPNYTSLMIFRCLVGIGLGGGPVFLCWFLEFVPASNRGKWMVVHSIFWTLGTIFEAALAWIVMPRLSWRWLLAVSSLPSMTLLLSYYLVPESPRYLCTKGRFSDAHRILEKMAVTNEAKLPTGMLVSDNTTEADEESSSSSHKPLLSSATKEVLNLKSTFSSFFVLFSPKLIKTTFLLWVLFFGNSFLYYGIILLTSELSGGRSKCRSATLLLENHQDDSLYIDVFITSLAELPGILLCAIIVDRMGRKLSLIFLLVVASFFLFPLVSHQAVISTTTFLFGARMCAIGSFTVACIYCPELYPTSVRTTGTGVASAVGRIGGMICPLVAVGLVSGCHVEEAIILFEAVIAVSIVCVVFFPFETKGCELSDNVAAFDPKHNIFVR